MKVSILGAGSWGTALGQILVDNKNEVLLWSITKDTVDEINNAHTNSAYFGKDVILPAELKATDSLEKAVDFAECIIFAIPTIAISDVAKNANKILNKKVYIVNVSKGFNPGDDERMSNTLRNCIDEEKRYPIVSLIGPSHAEEVILRMLTLVTSTCLDLETGKVIQELFSNNYFRVYTNEDEIGAEVGAAVKNTIALAAGCLVGLGYGDNAKAALVTRGLVELSRFGIALGGQIKTFFGLTGLGDLMVTCNSMHSRNFCAGLEIGKTRDVEGFLKSNKKTVEGLRTCKVIHDLSQKYNIEMPICDGVYQVLYNHADPVKVIEQLMLRTLKNEDIN